MDGAGLKPANGLAANGIRFPNESAEYRRARKALLAEEIELRRQIERVAEQAPRAAARRRSAGRLSVRGREGPVRLSDLFGRHDTLVTYNCMYGPKRERPCPMCTSLLSAWDGEVPDIEQRVAMAVIATLADRAAARVQARARLAPPQALFRPRQQLQPRLCRRDARGRRHPGPQRLHPPRRHHPPFLGGRDDRCDRRPRPGPARRARSDAALDDSRHDARGPRHRLVSEARVRSGGLIRC